MTFVLSGEVRISGKTAKAEIKDLEQSQDRLKASSQRMSAEGRKAASSNRQMGTAARGATKDYDRLSVAEQRAAREAMTFGRASKNAAVHTRGMAGGMRNLGLQLNQVAQVGGMTGNWMQALAVQLPDMLLGFGALGIGAGILAGAMIPLIGTWMDGADAATDLEGAMDVLGEIAEDIDGPLKILKMTIGQLEKEYGAAAGRTREFALAQARLKQNQSEGRLRDQVGLLNELTDGYDTYVARAGRAREKTAEFRDDLRDLVQDLSLTKEQGYAVADAFDQLREAQSTDEQSDALKGILDTLTDMGVPLSEMPDDLQRAIDEMITLNIATAETEASMARLEAAAARVTIGPQSQRGRGGDPRQFGGSFLEWNTVEAGEFLSKWKPPKKPRRGGGGGTGQQADALGRLVAQQQLQLDVLRETDPVLREMLRHRKALAGASDEERAALRDLIGARLDEEDALKSNGELHDTFRDSLYSSIQGLTLEGEKAVDVLENIGMAIANAALQAALLGEGPLAQIFGLSGGGGFLGMLATSLFPGTAIPAAAGGGRLSGPGTGTSDDILMWGSDGEFMVNAAATARHLPLLEALNSNAPIPAFAAGGMVSPPSVRRSGGHGQSELPPIVEINNYGSTPISGEAEHSVDSSGRRHVSMELADAVGNAMTTPGGGAKKVLRNKYNVKQRGTKR